MRQHHQHYNQFSNNGKKISRRVLLAGASAAALLPRAVNARLPHGQDITINHGWNTLPLGSGGLVTGMDLANDGTLICRTDVGGIYLWSGTSAISSINDPSQKWLQLINTSALTGINTSNLPRPAGYIGAWEFRIAPGNSDYLYAVLCDFTGVSGTYWIYYSTNRGTTWNKTNVSMYGAGSNDHNPPDNANCYSKMAVDPVNEKIVYVGTPNARNTVGVYTTFDRASGTTWPTLNAATTDGSTVFSAATVNPGTNGIVIDPSKGTTAIKGQIVTKHIIIPVGGIGIYESMDGGQTFTEIAISAFGGSNFSVQAATCNRNGVYYCIIYSATLTKNLWRYVPGSSAGAGTWTEISPIARYVGQGAVLIVDPRKGQEGYLSITGSNGVGAGYTTTNADSGSPPTWSGLTGGEWPICQALSLDIAWMKYAGGNHANAFLEVTQALVDSNGTCFWSGAGSIWYFGGDDDPTPSGPPHYTSSFFRYFHTYSWSFGRGMEATVTQDVLCPPGGVYPVLAPQDCGAPMMGTFTSYPQDIAYRYKEYCCESLEYAASDPSFVIARVTGQNGEPFGDYSCYSKSYGVDGSWTTIANTPTSLWQTNVIGSISDENGNAGNVLTVTSVTGGPAGILPYHLIKGRTFYGGVAPYGTNGTTGTGGTGTYYIITKAPIYGGSAPAYVPPGSTLNLQANIQGGQIVAVDHDHWVAIPSGVVNFVPAYTTNATSPSCSWSLTNLPPSYWMMRGWSFGPTPKPLAVGYGTDLGTVWAATFKNNTTSATITLYRSTNLGASFLPIGSIPAGVSCTGVYVLPVPGSPNELWLTGSFTGGAYGPTSIWHVTNANTGSATFTAVTTPGLPLMLTLGAPATPGGYPKLYAVFISTYGKPQHLYQGTHIGRDVSWSLYGPTGQVNKDLPPSCQVVGLQSIRGDWNVYGRLYASSNQCGFAYYNP